MATIFPRLAVEVEGGRRFTATRLPGLQCVYRGYDA